MNNSTKFTENPKDYVLKGDEKILKPRFNFNEVQKSFRQFPVSKNSCSIHGAMTTVANTFNINFSLFERQEIWEEAKKLGASDDRGWYFADAIKLVQKYCLENKDLDFKYFAIKKENFLEYARKGFAISGGVKILEGSTRDKLKDGYIGDEIEKYGDAKFGHAVCFTMIGDEFGFVDNYPGKTKVNTPKFHNLDELLKVGYFFNTGYICMENVEVVRDGYNFLTFEEKMEKLRNRPEVIALKKANGKL